MVMRALVDANIFISALLSNKSESPTHQVVRAFFLGKFTLVLPDDLFGEVIKKLTKKPYLSERITVAQAERMTLLLSQLAERQPPITQAIPLATRDPKDDYLLAHALINQVDYLITGDKDLLVLKQVKRVRILSPKEFLSILD